MSQPKQPNPYLKYTNMAVQMAAVIGLSVYGGQQLDEHYLTSEPWFTIVLSLVGIGASLYLTLRDLLRNNK